MAPQWTLAERGTSAAVAVLTTFLLLLLLYRLSPFPTLEESPMRMSVRLVTRPAPQALPVPTLSPVVAPSVPARPATGPSPSSAVPAPIGLAPSGVRPGEGSQSNTDSPSPGPDLDAAGASRSSTESDKWDALPSQGSQISFQRDFLRREATTLKELPAGRFRMKREITPQDIVRGASQVLGFWPPGYTDDPCGGIRRSVQQLNMASTPREKTQLADAVRLRQMYCQ